MDRTLAWSLLLFGAACAVAPAPAPTGTYTLVLLRTGPRTEPLGAEAQREVFGGHFANMERLAEARHLLLAGPFGRDRSDATLRGVFVLDTGDLAQAQAWAETDPGFRAGVFAFEYHLLSTEAPLRAVLESELARRDEAVARGQAPKPGDGARNHALLTVDDGERAEVLRGHGAVICVGRLGDGRAIAWIDAENAAAARELLAPIAPRLGAHHFDDWFGSDRLAALCPR